MHFSENLFLNFHAHQQLPAEGEMVIQSIFLQEDLIANQSDKIFFTSGLHPWHADLMNQKEIKNRLEKLIQNKSIIAVGETGIDKLKGPSVDKQIDVLKAHIDVADKCKVPLIIHSVKAHNEILKLKIDSKSKVPWVIHHFNGSKQMALDFIEHGFYLSVCYHIDQKNSRLSEYISKLPIDRIFLETDDFDVDIKYLYQVAAEKFGIGVDELKKQIIKNLNKLFNE